MKHEALVEHVVRDLRFDWESRGGGYYPFMLLSALDPTRLTDLGRRRLGEYQRKFGTEEPVIREGMRGGSFESPISGEAVSHMSDENWVQAMHRHDADRSDWETFKGGAQELSYVLRQQTAADPVRFAKLALRLTEETNSAYGTAILMGLGDADVETAEAEIIFDGVRHIANLGVTDNDRWLGFALQKYVKTVPLDLVETIRDRALSSADPIDDREFASGIDREPGDNLRMAGMNTARGSLAEQLGNLLVFDGDGARTAAVVPVLEQMASDPVLSVRSQVAHTIAGALNFDRENAVKAFWKLIDTADALLTSPFVRQLMVYIGNGGEVAAMIDVIKRMLASEDPAVRECGGDLAAFAALQWQEQEPLNIAMAAPDEHARRGVARACARQLVATRNAGLAATTLMELFDDPSEEVRKLAAESAAALRGERLQPFEAVLTRLINSASFEAATPQLFLTLEHAPDQVGGLVLRAAQRFVEISGSAAGDIRTSAAGDVHYVSELVVRGLAQSRDQDERSALLDVVDELMKFGAYGVEEAVEGAGR